MTLTLSFFFFFILLVVLVLALALGPVQPASDIVSHVLIPLLVGNLSRRGRTPAGTAEKDDILLWLRLGKGEFLNANRTSAYVVSRRTSVLDVPFESLRG